MENVTQESQTTEVASTEATTEATTVDGSGEAQSTTSYLDGKYDIMYFIEVMDTKGNGRMYPDMENEIPYIVVNIQK